jgi:hypothetical protein
MPPYDFLRLPFFGALLMGRFVVPFFALPGPLPCCPAPLPDVRRFRPSLPPFIAFLHGIVDCHASARCEVTLTHSSVSRAPRREWTRGE